MTDKFQSFITVFMLVDTIIAEMKNIRTLTKRRAVSPVIATVIIVAVTITVAVAVSYWMSGIASQYTSFEKVEIQTAICKYETDGTNNYWEIAITLKNSGTKAATLTNVFVNDVETEYSLAFNATSVDGITAILDPDLKTDPLHIESGVTDEVTVWIIDNVSMTLSSGTTINVKIHSASGMDYIRLVQLT